jgi:hypothetical protein
MDLIFLEIEWKREWFGGSKYPRNFWNSTENYRIFLDKVARENLIKKSTDWQKISHSLIRTSGGNVIPTSYFPHHSSHFLRNIEIHFWIF